MWENLRNYVEPGSSSYFIGCMLEISGTKLSPGPAATSGRSGVHVLKCSGKQATPSQGKYAANRFIASKH